MVPAVTISPSRNFRRAKFFASVSLSNVLVDRWLRRRTNVPLFGNSNVTYQVGVLFDEGIGRSRFYVSPAVASSFAQTPPLFRHAATIDCPTKFTHLNPRAYATNRRNLCPRGICKGRLDLEVQAEDAVSATSRHAVTKDRFWP